MFGTAFFFSVQTLSTTGYGAVYPVSLAANIVSVFEMLMGLMGTALAPAILFARLSRPQARVMFSKVAVVRTLPGRADLDVPDCERAAHADCRSADQRDGDAR